MQWALMLSVTPLQRPMLIQCSRLRRLESMGERDVRHMARLNAWQCPIAQLAFDSNCASRASLRLDRRSYGSMKEAVRFWTCWNYE